MEPIYTAIKCPVMNMIVTQRLVCMRCLDSRGYIVISKLINSVLCTHGVHIVLIKGVFLLLFCIVEILSVAFCSRKSLL